MNLRNLLFSLCILMSLIGCSSVTQNAVKTEGVIITTVNTGMAVWRDYVVAGNATQAQVDKVHALYDTYYNAQLVAKAAIEKALATGAVNSADLTTANASVKQAESALVAILNQYLKK